MTHSELLEAFTHTTDALLHLLSPLSEAKLNAVPYEGSWTAAQLGDHLYKSYGIATVLNGKTEPTTRPVEEKVEGIKGVFLNFDIRMQSPEFIVPDNGPFDKTILLGGLTKRIHSIKEYIKNTNDLSVTYVDFELPRMGTLTGMEWIQFMTMHTIRHVRQLKRIVEAL
jgi:hypothetical protein